jgi:hypothetical protein
VPLVHRRPEEAVEHGDVVVDRLVAERAQLGVGRREQRVEVGRDVALGDLPDGEPFEQGRGVVAQHLVIGAGGGGLDAPALV